MNIAFQGRPGAYSQQAIFAYDAVAQTLPFRPRVTSLRCLDSYCIVDKQE